MKNPIYTITHVMLVILLLSTSAKTYAQKTVNFEIDDFEEVIELKGEILKFSDPFLNPSRILLHDGILFVSNSNVSPSIDVFNINTGKRISQFCKKGRGPGELVFPFSTQVIEENNKFMIHDLNGKKIVLYSIDLILKNADKKYTEVINVNDIYPRKLVRINDNSYFCGLIGHQDEYMNCIVDSTGNVIRYLNKFPDLGTKYNPAIASNLFSTNIGISNDNKTVIIPYDYWDRIDLFGSDGDFQFILKGPNYKKLDFTEQNGLIVKTSKNNRAYNYPVANDKSFIIPYSGKKRNRSGPSHTDLFQFDFEGRPLRHYKLDVPIFDIAVDWENNIIYGINLDLEPCIYKFRF